MARFAVLRLACIAVVATGASALEAQLREPPTAPPPRPPGERTAPAPVQPAGPTGQARLRSVAEAQMERIGIREVVHGETIPVWLRTTLLRTGELRQDPGGGPAVFSSEPVPVPFLTFRERSFEYGGRVYLLRLSSEGASDSGERAAYLIAETETESGKRLAGFLMRMEPSGGSFRFLPQGKWAEPQSCFFTLQPAGQ